MAAFCFHLIVSPRAGPAAAPTRTASRRAREVSSQRAMASSMNRKNAPSPYPLEEKFFGVCPLRLVDDGT